MVTDGLWLEVDLMRVAIKRLYDMSRGFKLDDALYTENVSSAIYELQRIGTQMLDAQIQLQDCVSSFSEAKYSGEMK